jgi:GNAT superfamily N-acetyltransferase
MELKFRKAKLDDGEIVYTAIQELLEKPMYSLIQFESYWVALLSGEYGKNDVWLASKDEKVCAYILANYYPIPRYMGQGVELEEVVTLPEYQRMGIGKAFIQFLMAHYVKDTDCRKIAIKTDDLSGSGKLYITMFERSNMQYYHKYLNKL